MKTAPPSIAPSVISGLRRWVLPACSALLLAACGGGGGGGTTGDTSGSTTVLESAPAAVTDVTAVASSDNAIVLTFKVSNPQSVTAFEAVCSGNGSSVTMRSASSGTATDTLTVTGLTNAPSYSCTVSAINSSGASSASSPVQATAGTTGSTPGAPGVLSMEGASTSAVLTFSESTVSGGAAVSTYVGICVGSDKTSYSFAAASPITVLGLTPDLPYTCWVSGLNAQGSGKASAASVVTPKAATAVAADAPAAPTGVSVTRGAGSATVAFSTGTAAASASKRRAQGVATVSGTLYRATCRKDDNVVSVESTTSPITVPQLTNGAGYSCSVTVTTTAGTSADSTASGVTPSTVPDAPALTALNAGDTTATLSFTAPASDGGAAITRYRASCASDTQTAAADASSAGTIVVAGLVNNSTYSCSVAAVNVAGAGAASNAMSAMPVASTTPVNGSVASAPQTVQASAANGNAVISFAAVTDSASPVLDYTATCTSGSQQISATGSTSPITVSGLSNSSTYSCSVTARTEAGNSPASGAQSVTPAATAPAAPTLVSVTPGDSAISVAFTAGSDGGAAVTAFIATCGDDKTGSGLASPVTVSGLTNGQIYACWVTATNGVGTSASSDKRDTRPRTVPQKPTDVSATAGNTIITLSYTAPSDNGGAEILGYTATCRRGDDNHLYVATSATSLATSITVSNLVNDKSYDCTVTADNTAGASKASASANATPAGSTVEKKPDAATNLAMSIGDKELTVTFDRPTSNGTDVSYALICSPGEINMAAPTGSVTATGLTNGTSYNCLIRAARGLKFTDAGFSTAWIPNVMPTAPTLGTVAAADQQLTIPFTKPAGNGSDTRYGASCGAGSVTAGDGDFVITGLTNGQTYSCTVTASNSKGDTSASTSGTPFTNPDAPGLSVTAGTASASDNATLNISITPANNGGSPISSYKLSCSGGGSAAFTPTLTGLSATASGLSTSTTYTCTVQAVSQAGGTSPEVSATATTAATPVTAPGVPGFVVNGNDSSAGNAKLNVSVTKPTNNGGSEISSYAVSCIVNGTTYKMNLSPTNSSTTISGLQNGKSYDCSATAKNAASLTSATTSATGTTAITVPGAPAISVASSANASNGTATLTITLTEPADGGSTISSYAGTCTVADTIYNLSVSDLSAKILGLPRGSSYNCTATAKNDKGDSAAATAAGTTSAVTAPGAPTIAVTGTNSSAGNAVLNISLTASADSGGETPTYSLACSVSGSSYNNSAVTLTTMAATLSGLPNNASYICTATATNTKGGTSTATATGTTAVTVPGAPASATLSYHCSTSMYVNNTVPAANGGNTVTGYKIDLYSVSGGIETFFSTRTIGSAASNYDVAGANGKTFRAKISAINAVGIGPATTTGNVSISSFPSDCPV